MSNYADKELTKEQREQWNDYSCESRCLMKLEERKGEPLTAEEFCGRFEHHFPRPHDRYGILKDNSNGVFRSVVDDIARELGLSDKLVNVTDYDEVSRYLNREGREVLLVSGIDLNPGATGEINHCSVITAMDDLGFRIWTTSQDGSDGEMALPKSAWVEKRCYGVVFM